MKISCSIYTLTCLSFAFGAVAGVTLCLAVATDAWIFMSVPQYPHPDDLRRFNMTRETVTPIMLHVRSGFWRVCTTNIQVANITVPDHCIKVDYTQRGSGRHDGAGPSMSVVGAIRISAPCIVIALILGLSAIIFHVTGTINSDYKTLVAGVLYILSGLVLAVGIILFISAVNDEVGFRLTKKTEHPLTYQYGWSFFIAGISFATAELAAVVCVTIFLRRHSKLADMMRIIPGLEEKLDKDCQRLENQTQGVDNNQTILYLS